MSLRQHLPEDIWVNSIQSCARHFDPSKDVKIKVYAYYFAVIPPQNRYLSSSIDSKYVRIFHSFDLETCQLGLSAINGEHNFKHFTAAGSNVKNTLRTITQVSLQSPSPGHFILLFEAKGFLKQMLRNLVAGLWMVSSGKLTLADWNLLLSGAGEKKQRWRPAPAQGLWLESIVYL